MWEEHPHAFAYDWRHRFGLPLSAVFDGRMTWPEAWALANGLMFDPTSLSAAAVAGWEYPFSREAKVLADLWDLTLMANTPKKKRGRVKPYPRPWKTRRGRRSKTPTVDQATVRAALAARGFTGGR